MPLGGRGVSGRQLPRLTPSAGFLLAEPGMALAACLLPPEGCSGGKLCAGVVALPVAQRACGLRYALCGQAVPVA